MARTVVCEGAKAPYYTIALYRAKNVGNVLDFLGVVWLNEGTRGGSLALFEKIAAPVKACAAVFFACFFGKK